MNKWRMYVESTNMNKACPKDSFLLPSIDRLVDSYLVMSFMDEIHEFE